MPKKKLNGERLLDSIVHDLEYQRPQMSARQAGELEAAVLESSASTRSAGLTSLILSGRKLIKEIAGKRVDKAIAVDRMKLAYALRDYAERLRRFALLMDSASTWI